MKEKITVVTGAGGFIGGHLVDSLLKSGKSVRAVDIKPTDSWHQIHNQAENWVLDLSDKRSCEMALENAGIVYNLSADMGGMGFIEKHKAECMLSVLINTHLLLAAKKHRVKRFFFASSACVYNADKQKDPKVIALKEEDAYPALPEDGYGWEKLFSERMCRHFSEDFGLETRIARFHNVYGTYGTFEGGREKAPAAISRKVVEAILNKTNSIEIWGDGRQSRSFMWIDDCIKGMRMIAEGDYPHPVNLGSSELVSVNGLVDIVESIAGVRLKRTYLLDAPKGVNGRNSDNTLVKEKFGWEPSTPLRVGMKRTYSWIYGLMAKRKVGTM